MSGNEPAPVPHPSEAREIESIIANFGGEESPERLYALLHDQLSLIYGRATSLVQIASVVITVTGFSGRIIADTNKLAQALIIGGVTLVALAAAVAFAFVLPVRWITLSMHRPVREWMLLAIRRRDLKVRAIKAATGILILGMAFYIAAVSIMLANPELTELQRVR